jgi:hypothetical protein
MIVGEASGEALARWDEMAVIRPGGHVYQSRAWAAYCARLGWRPRFLRFDDGFCVLALERRWPIVPGGSAYVSRGPIPADGDPGMAAARLAAVADRLAADGMDVVASDAEIEAAGGYPALIAANGFRSIAEIQPSRHRLSLPLAGADETSVFTGIAKSTRQRIRSAERDGVVVVRHDTATSIVEGCVAPTEAVGTALGRFYDLLLATGERRRFTFGPRAEFMDWWTGAHRDGYLVLLEARVGDEPLGDLLIYRHGDRLSTVHSADRADARRAHPGIPHLLRWRAIQLALAEHRAEMDLGGVDVAGARRPPVQGEPMYGLYQHKLSFGAHWLELSGAHERVIRPRRYLAGRVLSAAARRTGRFSGRGSAGPR